MVFENDRGMTHSMHFHRHVFQVEIDGTSNVSALRLKVMEVGQNRTYSRLTAYIVTQTCRRHTI